MIFVDTSFWYALENRRDTHHDESLRLLRDRSGSALLTTNHVRGETWTLLRRREGHRRALRFLDRLDTSPRVQLVHVSEDVEETALDWLRRHDERGYSFVDATSFVVMARQRIRTAFAFDGDFTAAGYEELRGGA